MTKQTTTRRIDKAFFSFGRNLDFGGNGTSDTVIDLIGLSDNSLFANIKFCRIDLISQVQSLSVTNASHAGNVDGAFTSIRGSVGVRHVNDTLEVITTFDFQTSVLTLGSEALCGTEE